MTFLSPTAPYNDNPRLDLDMNSYSLVKSYRARPARDNLPGHGMGAKRSL